MLQSYGSSVRSKEENKRMENRQSGRRMKKKRRENGVGRSER